MFSTANLGRDIVMHKIQEDTSDVMAVVVLRGRHAVLRGVFLVSSSLAKYKNTKRP